jgi:CsoR family transcriptional regulator, copper-sensing transcriptional repressor
MDFIPWPPTSRSGPSRTIPPWGIIDQVLIRGGSVPTRGYSATKEDLKGRLARIEGQVKGISKMVDDDRYCIDVLTQINAVRAALDKVALGLLDGHVKHCLVEGKGRPEDPEDRIDELMAAVGRMVGH